MRSLILSQCRHMSWYSHAYISSAETRRPNFCDKSLFKNVFANISKTERQFLLRQCRHTQVMCYNA